MLPVPLNSSKNDFVHFELVSVRAVAIMVREPPFSMLRAAPKKRFGFCSAFASTPPESILPDAGDTVLYARARRVIESSNITTSCPHSTILLAFSSTIEAILTCLSAGSSNVDAITSAFTLRLISVTSSGRSSMRSIIIYVSGWFSAIALAMSFSNIVLPVLGGATIRPRWPFSDRGEHIHHACGYITCAATGEVEFFIREQWCQMLERHTVADIFGERPFTRDTFDRQ